MMLLFSVLTSSSLKSRVKFEQNVDKTTHNTTADDQLTPTHIDIISSQILHAWVYILLMPIKPHQNSHNTRDKDYNDSSFVILA